MNDYSPTRCDLQLPHRRCTCAGTALPCHAWFMHYLRMNWPYRLLGEKKNVRFQCVCQTQKDPWHHVRLGKIAFSADTTADCTRILRFVWTSEPTLGFYKELKNFSWLLCVEWRSLVCPPHCERTQETGLASHLLIKAEVVISCLWLLMLATE